MKQNQKGFSLIELLIVVVIIGIIAAIAIPNLLASRRAANESAAIATIRTVTGAQATFQSTAGSGNYGTGAQLNSSGLIDNVIGCASNCEKSGYKFNITLPAPPAGTTKNIYFDAKAEPTSHGTGVSGTGTRSFYTNESGMIYYTDTGTAPTVNASTRVVTGSPMNN